jgi:hypothetical protein
MGLLLEENHVVVLEENEILAVRQSGKVEVWSTDGETHYGTLDEYATPNEVRSAMRFYRTGIEHGEEIGRNEIQNAIRSTLGMN